MSDGPAPRISSIALANLIKDHRAKNEWNTAIEFYLRGYEDLTARVAEFRAVLDDLYSVQNGCPLPKYQTDWDAAMLAAGRLLGYRIPAADSGSQS